MVKIIDINEKNIDEEALFCKKTKKKFPGYQNKVKWMKERFKEGLKYKVLYVNEGNKERSRGMIEYIPGKFNWRGIKADNWMVIHCIWVVGKAKQKGYGSKLLQLAIEDAKKLGLHGVVGISAEKGGWVPKKRIYLKNGFVKVDEVEPNFNLYALFFDQNNPKPYFNPISTSKQNQYSKGATIIYSDQCPYISDLVGELKEIDVDENLNVIKINECKDAQENAIYPYGTYCIICEGEISLYKHETKKKILNIIKN